MKLLAVDASGSGVSVAVAEDGRLLCEVRLGALDVLSRRLLPLVEMALGLLGLAPGEIEAYAVTTGPGAFTAVRVALATVQGLALAGGRPCLGVPTLDAMAEAARGEGPAIVALIDAFRGEVFAAAYDGEAQALGGPVRATPEAVLAAAPEAAVFVGSGAIRHAELIGRLRPQGRLGRDEAFLAAHLARLAGPRLAAGKAGPAAALRALYLREADIDLRQRGFARRP
jgi:tRNA threonylcarbamoyladenosine biosynthesis protein TsaB